MKDTVIPFSQRPASSQWSSLAYRGITFAEVWIKPDSLPTGLTIRIPATSLVHPIISPLLSLENLLKAIIGSTEEVESFRYEDQSNQEIEGYVAEFNAPLPAVPDRVTELRLQVSLKSADMEANEDQCPVVESKSNLVTWQDLLVRWNLILGMEVTLDTLRQRMESLKLEIEHATGKSLSPDEKVNAMNADVAQWNKAKSRARYVLPRVKEFIHRATWAMGTPERKKLDEIFKVGAEPASNLPELDRELFTLLKDRQLLAAQGNAGYQEGRNSCDDIQRIMRTLQSNAASNAVKKRAATRGKTF